MNEFVSRERGGHGYMRVHVEMLLTICRWYTALPDLRTMTASEIRFWFEGLREELKKASAPKQSKAR